jgi:hypothetical protein
MTVLRGLWDHHPSERYADVDVPVLLVPVEHRDPAWNERVHGVIDTALATLPTARARWLVGDHDIHAQRPGELAIVMHEMTTDGFVP